MHTQTYLYKCMLYIICMCVHLDAREKWLKPMKKKSIFESREKLKSSRTKSLNMRRKLKLTKQVCSGMPLSCRQSNKYFFKNCLKKVCACFWFWPKTSHLGWSRWSKISCFKGNSTHGIPTTIQMYFLDSSPRNMSEWGPLTHCINNLRLSGYK